MWGVRIKLLHIFEPYLVCMLYVEATQKSPAKIFDAFVMLIDYLISKSDSIQKLLIQLAK